MRNSVIVVIDVLRASTTILCLMEQGVEEVKVVDDLHDAYRLKDYGYALIGERGDEPLPGFDLDNSPGVTYTAFLLFYQSCSAYSPVSPLLAHQGGLTSLYAWREYLLSGERERNRSGGSLP